MEELKIMKSQLHQELTIQSSAFKTIRAQHPAEKLLMEEELWEKAMATIKETCRHDIQVLRGQIKSLAQ